MNDDYQGAFGSANERRAPCPECGSDRRVQTLWEKIQQWDIDEISGFSEFYVFKCRGCETTFFARSNSDSEDYHDYYDFNGEHQREYMNRKSFWPSVKKTPTQSWAGFNLRIADETLYELLRSIYKALNEDMPVLAAIGMRTAFDRVSELLGISTKLSFAKKLDEMRNGGHISEVQKSVLEVLVDAGSAAAHRGWKPDEAQLATMREILEALIRDHFILSNKVAALKQKIPPRQ